MDDHNRYKESVEMCRDCLVNYRHIMLNNGVDELDPAPYHFEWSKMLIHGKGNDAIEAYRESGKTQYVLRAFLLYCLQYPSEDRDYIVLIKKNARLASAKLRETINEYKGNPAVSANCKEIVEQSGNVFSVDVTGIGGKRHNIRIEAYGKGASIRGLANIDRRPKIVIIDDPQDVEDALSEAVQINDWNWFLSDVMFLGQKTRIFIIGNNLGEFCIVERIAANAEELGFTFKRLPIVVREQSVWPNKYTREFIDKEQDGFRKLGKIDIWLRERMCVAISDETRIFKKNDFRYFDYRRHEDIIAAGSNNFMCVDPAASLKDASDYRAMVVGLVTSDNHWFIPEVSYGHYDTMKVIDEMFRLVVEYEIKDVGIEAGIYKSAVEPFIHKEMKRRNQFFNIIPLEHGSKRKEDRIRMLQPRFVTHSIFFPDEAHWLKEMESELLAFTMQGTRGLHDDLIDALAYMEQIARVPYKPTKRNRNLPRMAEMESALI